MKKTTNEKTIIVAVQSFSNAGKRYIQDVPIEVNADVYETLCKIKNSNLYFLELSDYNDSHTLVIDKKEELRAKEKELKVKEARLNAREKEIKEKESKLFKGVK